MSVHRGVFWSALLLVALLLLPLTAFATPTTAPSTRVNAQAMRVVATSNGTVVGTVRNSVSGLPIANALVVATGPANSSVWTNSSGQYSMSLPSGTYNLKASKGNYDSAYVFGVVVSSDTTITQNFSLYPLDPCSRC